MSTKKFKVFNRQAEYDLMGIYKEGDETLETMKNDPGYLVLEVVRKPFKNGAVEVDRIISDKINEITDRDGGVS